MEAAQSVDILVQILGGDTQITLSSSLDLTALCKALLGRIHVLVGILHLISQCLLLEIIIVLRGRLLLCCGIQLALCLVKEAVEGVDNATALAFVCCCLRSTG